MHRSEQAFYTPWPVELQSIRGIIEKLARNINIFVEIHSRNAQAVLLHRRSKINAWQINSIVLFKVCFLAGKLWPLGYAVDQSARSTKPARKQTKHFIGSQRQWRNLSGRSSWTVGDVNRASRRFLGQRSTLHWTKYIKKGVQ